MGVVWAVLLTGCGSGDDPSADDRTDADADGSTTPETSAEAPSTSTTAEPGPSGVPDPGGSDSEVIGDVGPPIDATTGGPNACAIAETLDLEGLLGEPPAPVDTRAGQDQSVCLVKTADPASKATVKLVIEPGTGAQSYAEAKAELGPATEPADLGDEAFHAGNHLFVLTGDTVVLVQVERRSIKVPSVEDAALEEAAAVILDAIGD
jgi:hypothetical protein